MLAERERMQHLVALTSDLVMRVVVLIRRWLRPTVTAPFAELLVVDYVHSRHVFVREYCQNRMP